MPLCPTTTFYSIFSFLLFLLSSPFIHLCLFLIHLTQLLLSHRFSFSLLSFLPLSFLFLHDSLSVVLYSLLPASMAGYSDPLGSQTSPAQMMDIGRMGAFSGILPIFSSTQQHCISTDAGTTRVQRFIYLSLHNTKSNNEIHFVVNSTPHTKKTNTTK